MDAACFSVNGRRCHSAEDTVQFRRIRLGALLTIDESTTIKNPKAKRTKSILLLSKRAKYRRILTGSPVTKSPLDLYTQCNFLNEFLLGFSSYYAFRNRYANMIDKNFGGRRVQLIGSYKNLDELANSIKAFSIVFKLPLPSIGLPRASTTLPNKLEPTPISIIDSVLLTISPCLI